MSIIMLFPSPVATCGSKASTISNLTDSTCRKSPNERHIPYSGEEKNNYYCKYCGSRASTISNLAGSTCRKSPNERHIPAK